MSSRHADIFIIVLFVHNCPCPRILLKGAQENGGIVVSNDRFRDVAESHPEMMETIENW